MSYSEGTLFSRQMLVPGFGQRGQEKLRASRVLIVGMGGLGCPAALYLAAMGVGLGLLDGDVVEASNLPRQILYGVSDVGDNKVEAARRALTVAYPYTSVEVKATYVNVDNVYDLTEGYDVVINGVDDYTTRVLLNQACMTRDVPWIDGGAVRMTGYVGAFSRTSGCYECLFPALPPDEYTASCKINGILPPVVGAIGTRLALQAIAILTGVGTPLFGCLAAFDASTGEWSQLHWDANPECWCQQLLRESCSTQVEPALQSNDVSAVEAWDQLAAGTAALWDVRSAGEREALSILGAEPHPEILDGEIKGTMPTRPVNVICATGIRSAVATWNLRTMGVDARNVNGGIKAWEQHGLPVRSKMEGYNN